MASQMQPEFSGGITEDLSALVDVFRAEVRTAAGRSEPFFDLFSVAVNDGISMLVNRQPGEEDRLDEGEENGFCEYNLDGLISAQEEIEIKYWEMESAGDDGFAAADLVALDQRVLDLYDQAASRGHGKSMLAGVHTRFAGDAQRPQWSLFIQNEGLRKMVCAVAAQEAVHTLFSGRGPEEGGCQVVYMPVQSPYSPIGLTVPRAVQQLRSQCLNPEVIILARRGMVVRALSAEALWETYSLVTQKLEEDIRSRLRKLPWIFQGTGDMLGENLIEPATTAVASCLGNGESLKMWDTSREGVLRKALCLPELLDLIEKGFPDQYTAALAGCVPLVVRLGDSESPASVSKRIQQAWEAYRQDTAETRPLSADQDIAVPYVIVLANLGVLTTLHDPTEAHAAYSALAESLSILEGARAYGGMQAIPYREARALAASPLRRPSAASAIGIGVKQPQAPREEPAYDLLDETDDDLDTDAEQASLSVEEIRIRPPLPSARPARDPDSLP